MGIAARTGAAILDSSVVFGFRKGEDIAPVMGDSHDANEDSNCGHRRRSSSSYSWDKMVTALGHGVPPYPDPKVGT